MPEDFYPKNTSFNISSLDVVSTGHCEDMITGILVWATFSSLFSILGSPACVAVLLELFQRHNAGTPFTPNDIFMLNITCMDLVFLLFIPFGCCDYLLWHVQELQVFTNFLCSLNLAGRPLLTTCICFDCYLAVVHPVFYRANKSTAPRLLMCAVVWTITLIQGALSTIIDEFFHSPWAMFVYVIALPIITTCNIFIFCALKSTFPGKTNVHPKKKKALQIITNSMVMTFVAYVPPVLGYILGGIITADEHEYECFVAIPILIAPAAGSAIMPLLYLGNLGKLGSLCNN
ncbi:G-protein coupled receptor 15-like [Eucyclogobius newberryi]|uniref:G-protein coupled receptor 15-like n=1 Tax=Eucyclogobius newberryi TaxID=166745 RepID=UPI003B5C15A7